MSRTPLYDELGCNGYVTFGSALTRGTDENKVVKVSAAHTVALCSAGEYISGVVRTIAASDKAAGVQMDGFAVVSGSADVALNWSPIEADGLGGVRKVGSPAQGTQYFYVVDVDATNGTVTIKL
jgi:hypothetical protein